MKKVRLLWSYLLMSIFFTGCQTLTEMNESADISRGWRDHRRGRYEEAVTDFSLALQENPQSAPAYFGLAVAWEDKGDYDKAKEYYSKAIALDPRSAFLSYEVGSNKPESVYIRRAWRESAKGNYNQAVANFNLALTKNPRSAEAYVGLSSINENKRYYDRALEYISKAIEIEPKAGYFWLRGDLWQSKEIIWGSKKRDFERAVEDYTSAINRDPGFAAAYTDRGSCYISMGKYETALADYKKALELVPPDDQTPYALRVRKIASEAIRDLQRKR